MAYSEEKGNIVSIVNDINKCIHSFLLLLIIIY